MDLVDDLLEIASEDRFEKARDPRSSRTRLRTAWWWDGHCTILTSGSPSRPCDVVEQIAVPEAAPMLHALGMVDLRPRRFRRSPR